MLLSMLSQAVTSLRKPVLYPSTEHKEHIEVKTLGVLWSFWACVLRWAYTWLSRLPDICKHFSMPFPKNSLPSFSSQALWVSVFCLNRNLLPQAAVVRLPYNVFKECLLWIYSSTLREFQVRWNKASTSHRSFRKPPDGSKQTKHNVLRRWSAYSRTRDQGPTLRAQLPLQDHSQARQESEARASKMPQSFLTIFKSPFTYICSICLFPVKGYFPEFHKAASDSFALLFGFSAEEWAIGFNHFTLFVHITFSNKFLNLTFNSQKFSKGRKLISIINSH